VLARGPSTKADDDLLLEVKELPPQGSPPLPGTTAFATPAQRVLAALGAGWTERGADPLWGVGSWAGFPVQIRTEAAGFKTIHVARLEGTLGTPEAVQGLGVSLARLIARMHAAPVQGSAAAPAIAEAIASDPEGFADEQVDVALAACDRTLADWGLFNQALALLGPTLGVPGDPGHAPSDDLHVLYDPGAEPRSAGVDPLTGPVAINEICAVGCEYVELVNASGSAQSIAGSAVADADDDGGPRFEEAARFPAGATLGAGGRATVVGGFEKPDQGLRSDCIPGVSACYQAAWDISDMRGETMFLLGPDDVILDQAAYPGGTAAQGEGQSWGRLPDGAGPFTMGAASPDKPNQPP
jgi:hypothetical protein